MRTARPILNTLVLAILALFLLTIVAEVMARGPGGPRGGHRRFGPASRGNFTSPPMQRSQMRPSSRPTTRSGMRPSQMRTTSRPSTRPSQPSVVPPAPPEEHQERREEIREQRQERREEIRDAQQEQWRENRRRAELGTVYTSDYFYDDCEASVVVGGITYYECEGVWYRRAYSGSEVTYVVVEGPRSE